MTVLKVKDEKLIDYDVRKGCHLTETGLYNVQEDQSRLKIFFLVGGYI